MQFQNLHKARFFSNNSPSSYFDSCNEIECELGGFHFSCDRGWISLKHLIAVTMTVISWPQCKTEPMQCLLIKSTPSNISWPSERPTCGLEDISNRLQVYSKICRLPLTCPGIFEDKFTSQHEYLTVHGNILGSIQSFVSLLFIQQFAGILNC